MQPEITVPEFDQLMAFAAWYQQQPLAIPLCPAFGFNQVGGFTGLTLYRKGPFQVQLWLCAPNCHAPDHAHPHVDSLQVYLSGQVYLSLNGEVQTRPEDIREAPNGLSTRATSIQRVRPGEMHGASAGPKGGAFLTIQHWLKGEPHSVENDWEGEPIDEEHAKRLEHTLSN